MNRSFLVSLFTSTLILTSCQNADVQSVNDTSLTLNNENAVLCENLVKNEREVAQHKMEGMKEQAQKELEEQKSKLDQCQDQLEGNSLIFEESGIERYHNKKYGYTIEAPVSWGSIFFPTHPSTEFSEALSDDMEGVGPLLAGRSSENWDEYVVIEYFERSILKKENDSWIDFYEDYQMKGRNYFINDSIDGDIIGRITETDENSSQVRSYRLIQNENMLYVFSYDNRNSIHRSIVDSIELD